MGVVGVEARAENDLGARIYAGSGGIEVLENADFDGGIWIGDPIPDDYELIEIPDEELFQRPKRIERAVRVALKGIREGR